MTKSEAPEITDLDQALRRIEDLVAVIAFMRDEAYQMRRRIRSDRPLPMEISETFWAWAKACENVLSGGDLADPL